MNDITKKIEVLLFMAKEPLTLKKLVEILAISEEEALTGINQLKVIYQDRAIEINEVAYGYLMTTRSEYNDILESYVNTPIEYSLSPAAMETLAIVAYKQPITKSEIEAIRGVNSDSMVKSLAEKMLIYESGVADTIGRPSQYNTTEEFLKQFGINDPSEIKDHFEANIKKN